MRRHALLIGSFFLIGLALIVVAVMWLGGSNLLGQHLRAVVYFQGSVSGLYIGAPVTFRGVPVGQVEEIGIEVDQQTLAARIPVHVTLQLDPMQVTGGAKKDTLLDLPQLVRRGLRARMVAQSFVTGQKSIDLDFVQDAPVAQIQPGRVPEIPALADRFGALIDQVAQLPLGETVQELRQTLQALQQTLEGTRATLDVTAREVAATANDARTTLKAASAAIQELQTSASTTLAAATRLSDAARDTVVGVQPELQSVMAGAREAADSARVAMGRVAEMTAPGAPLRGDLDSAVRDLAQAARGLREWSELLEERPNAVLFGRERR